MCSADLGGVQISFGKMHFRHTVCRPVVTGTCMYSMIAIQWRVLIKRVPKPTVLLENAKPNVVSVTLQYVTSISRGSRIRPFYSVKRDWEVSNTYIFYSMACIYAGDAMRLLSGYLRAQHPLCPPTSHLHPHSTNPELDRSLIVPIGICPTHTSSYRPRYPHSAVSRHLRVCSLRSSS